MARAHPINGAMLIRTLRQGQVPLFEALFEEWSGVAMPRRAEILYGAGGEGLAISCVALGVSKQDFATLFLLSRRSEEHTSELQSLMRSSYAVFCLKNNKYHNTTRR